MPRLTALAIVASLLASGAMGRSESGGGLACPPLVDYDADVQAQAAADTEMLAADSRLIDMLSDYAVLRDQARACRA